MYVTGVQFMVYNLKFLFLQRVINSDLSGIRYDLYAQMNDVMTWKIKVDFLFFLKNLRLHAREIFQDVLCPLGKSVDVYN